MLVHRDEYGRTPLMAIAAGRLADVVDESKQIYTPLTVTELFTAFIRLYYICEYFISFGNWYRACSIFLFRQTNCILQDNSVNVINIPSMLVSMYCCNYLAVPATQSYFAGVKGEIG